MLGKFKNLPKDMVWIYARDPRVLGLVMFGVIALLVTWSGVKSIQTNYELQKQIAALRQQNEVAQLENSNLALKNKYFETDQFLELAARRQFGKAARGEKLVIVSKSVALAQTVEPLQSLAAKTAVATNKPVYQKNFEAWLNFFLHRQNQ